MFDLSCDEILKYSIEHSNTPSKLCDELERETHQTQPMSEMLIGKLEASLLGFLIRSIISFCNRFKDVFDILIILVSDIFLIIY